MVFKKMEVLIAGDNCDTINPQRVDNYATNHSEPGFDMSMKLYVEEMPMLDVYSKTAGAEKLLAKGEVLDSDTSLNIFS